MDFAKTMLRNYRIDRDINYNYNREKIDRAVFNIETETYFLNNMCLRFFENKNEYKNAKIGYIDEGYVFYYDALPLDLHYSTYRVNFFIGIKQIVENETEQFDEPGAIEVTKNGYEKYTKALDKRLESHGKYLYGLLCTENCPMYYNSVYRELIDSVRIRESLKRT